MTTTNGNISPARPVSLHMDENSITLFSPEVTSFRTRSCHSLPPRRTTCLVTNVELNSQQNLPPFVQSSKSKTAEKEKRSSCCCCLAWLRSCWKRCFTVRPRSTTPPSRSTQHRDSITSRSFLKLQRRTKSEPNLTSKLTMVQEESKREWGEERDGDVIYAIALKRVNRIACSPLCTPSDGLQWETQKVRILKGATLSRLVQNLCRCFMEEDDQRHFLTVFLATFRSFASAEDVLDVIIKENENLQVKGFEMKRQILSSTMRVLRTWVERFFEEDFFDPPYYPLLQQLHEYVEDCRKNEGIDVSDFLNYIKTKMKLAEKKRRSRTFESNDFSNARFSSYLPITSNLTSTPEHMDDESVNKEAVKIFLNLLTPRKVAEQLTLVDANFFLNVVPHHCLYAVRSSKGKPATVKATIDQFNRVVYSVLATCLHPMLKPTQRVKVFCKWIEVAQACRELKNFSSLRAVISGLQAHPVHRLKYTWQHIPHSSIHLFKELEQINTKDSILKVGTAKVNTERSSIHQVRKDASLRRQQDIHSGIMHGTVPYLGSLLSDLTFLHTAKPDFLAEGIINFDKRRKEFELLAQLRLWQVSCRSYHHIKPDPQFTNWFSSITLPTDEQANKFSKDIEAPPALPSPLSPSLSSSKFADVFAHHIGLSSTGSSPASLPAGQARAADLSPRLKPTSPKQNGHVVTNTTVADGERTVQIQIIKKNSPHQNNVNGKPKELKLSSNDRSPAFVRKAFKLFDLEEDVNNFQLRQLLPGAKELNIPYDGNVFYAMNSSIEEFNFMLVEKGATVPHDKHDSHRSTPFRKSKKRSKRILQTTNSQSPMRTIYKHLGISGFSWASTGCYSPSKEAQRRESEHETKDSSGHKSPRTNEKTKSLKTEKINGNKQLSPGPVEVYKPLDEHYLAPDLPSHSNNEQRSSSTWPRSHTFTLHDANDDEPKLQRRSAIRKHHSHPRETTTHLSVLSSAKMTVTRSYADNSSVSSAECLSTDASDEVRSSVTSRKSDLFVTFREHQQLQRHISAHVLESGMNDIVELDGKELRRSASDPCILDSIDTESDVFSETNINLVGDNMSKIRRSSQTTTTYL